MALEDEETLSGGGGGDAGDELEECPTRSASTSSNDDDDNRDEEVAEGEAEEMMAEDQQPSSDQLQVQEDEEQSEVLERLSCVSLANREPVSTAAAAAAMEKSVGADVSRSIMFNRYARAVPSAQENQPSASSAATPMRLPKVEFSVPIAASNGSTPLTPFTTPPDPLGCCSVSCQEQSKWKDERIHELQRALDHMVDAMAIQQRDMAAQRAFLARQSEQLTKLSMTLHQEKLSLQIERERIQKAATLSPSSSSRPPTPSGKTSRPPRGTSKPKASMKAVFSTLAGGSSPSSSRRESGRRSTVSSIGEHAVVAPAAMVYSPVSLSTASRSASASQLAQVVPASARDAVVTDNVRDTLESSSPSDGISDTFATEVERSMSLSALEIRVKQPVLSSSSNELKMQPPMSDVSLQDSPVRFGSRSATNCVKSEERQKGSKDASPPSAPGATAVTAASSPTAASSGDSKKLSSSERFRSLHWKS